MHKGCSYYMTDKVKYTKLKTELWETLRKELYALACDLLGDNKEDWAQAGEIYGVKSSTIYEAMRGDGSFDIYLVLIFGHHKLKPKNLRPKLKKIRKLLSDSDSVDEIENLIYSAMDLFGEQKFSAMLRFMISSHKIGIETGLYKKRGRPKKL